MPGTPVECRLATSTDLPVLVKLVCAEAVERAGSQDGAPGGTGLIIRGRSSSIASAPEDIVSVLRDRSSRVYVATAGSRVVGALSARVVTSSAAPQGRFVEVESLYVMPDQRRRGFGHALLAQTIGFADDVRAEHVVCARGLVSRSLQRFLLRLGFVSSSKSRVVPVEVLRRRLTTTVVARKRGHAFEDLVAKRRLAARAMTTRRSA